MARLDDLVPAVALARPRYAKGVLGTPSRRLGESIRGRGLEQPKPIVHALLFGRELDEDETPLMNSRRLDVPPHLRSDVKLIFASDLDAEAQIPVLESRRLEGVRRGQGSGAPHLRSDGVECAVFGTDGPESHGNLASIERLRRGKASGAPAGEWPKHMHSNVDRVVFGHASEGPEVLGEPPFEQVRRGKGSGAPAGVWPRHVRSDVERHVFSHDQDLSEAMGNAEEPSAAAPLATAASRRSHLLVRELPALKPPLLWQPEPTAVVPEPRGHNRQLSAASSGPYSPIEDEDLFALYRLHGGDINSIVQFLARQWGTSPRAIAPMVYSWLAHMPPRELLPLPSRSRSSPALTRVIPAASKHTKHTGLDCDALARVPAATAPANASAALTSALSGLHTASARLNATLAAKVTPHGGRHSAGASQMFALPHNPAVGFPPARLSASAIAAVPEDVPVEYGEDDALQTFMAHASLVGGEITPDLQRARRAAHGSVAQRSRSWQMRV